MGRYLFECDLDAKCQETFISYITFQLKKHFIGKVEKKVPENEKESSKKVK
jgi:hypothetical protein